MEYELFYEPITDNLNNGYSINMNTHCIVNQENVVQKFLIHGDFITLISNDNTSTTVKIVDLHINYKYAKLKQTWQSEDYVQSCYLDEYILNEYNIDLKNYIDFETFKNLSNILKESIESKSISLSVFSEPDDRDINFTLSHENNFFVVIGRDDYSYSSIIYRAFQVCDILVNVLAKIEKFKYVDKKLTELVTKYQTKQK